MLARWHQYCLRVLVPFGDGQGAGKLVQPDVRFLTAETPPGLLYKRL